MVGLGAPPPTLIKDKEVSELMLALYFGKALGSKWRT